MPTSALLGAIALCACASTPPPAIVAPEPAAEAPPPQAPPPEPVCAAFVRAGVLRRSALRPAIDAGVGQWLSGGVDVDRSPPRGAFQGWLVRRLYPGDPCYRDVDVRVGDVVVRINGKSIERPEQASDALASLTTAPALVVELLRAGQLRTVTLPIADE
jgi:S1-C subfamily serine protease